MLAALGRNITPNILAARGPAARGVTAGLGPLTAGGERSPARGGAAPGERLLAHLREAPAGAQAVDLHLVEAGDLHGDGLARLFLPAGGEAESGWLSGLPL